jgi:hypothetical protein
MTKTTRTLNPLPFQDLEPHRFEDLVRQIIYDFKNWRSLEPTGRLGSDDGYDARGLEITDERDEPENEETDDEESTPITTDRLWQIQCKREKSITPAKIEKYVDEMLLSSNPIPYGVIFAAPCDFSKKTRNAFAKKMQEKKVQEFYLWGKGDLEDMLMQPKNDHLLYAYFGISLVIRRRSLKSQIRSILAIKRKAVKHLGAIDQDSFVPVLIRDANDTHYPYMGDIPDFRKRPRWKMYDFVGHTHDGIRVLTRRFPAYRDIDNQTGKLLKWDYTDEVNLAIASEDLWNKEKDYDDKFRRAHDFLDNMEGRNRAFFEIQGVIPYERIIEIDPLGDTIAHCPHIFVEVRNDTFFEYSLAQLSSLGSYGYTIPIENGADMLRVKVFPKELPKVKERPLPPMGSEQTLDKEKADEANPEFEKSEDKRY